MKKKCKKINLFNFSQVLHHLGVGEMVNFLEFLEAPKKRENQKTR